MASRIEQIIEEIEEYIDGCKPQTFSSSKNYRKPRRDGGGCSTNSASRHRRRSNAIRRSLSNKEAILADAQAKADAIIAWAQVKTDEAVSGIRSCNGGHMRRRMKWS